MGFYALSFGEGTMEAEYRSAAVSDLAATQAWFDANPVVPPTPAVLLAGATDEAVLAKGAARFAKTCAPCHGEHAQGLIGPNLSDETWIHGGQVEQIFQSVVKGWPAKGMPPWGRAIPPQEIAALVSYLRSLQGSNPPGAKAPEGDRVAPEPLPGK
jgi:cytochrome c oxidase cbb3-type subunit 3